MKTAVWWLACAALLGLGSGRAQAERLAVQPAPGQAASAPADACRGWHFADHSPPPAVQLACLQRLPAARWSGIGARALNAEINYHYTQSALHGERATAEILRVLVNERERRQPPKQGARSKTVYAALLAAGALEAANQERREKGLDDVAELRAGSLRALKSVAPQEASYWTFDDSGDGMLVESSVDLHTGAHVVVYAGPECSFCVRLAQDLTADPALLALFTAHSLWVDVPDIDFSATYYQAWNRAHPGLKIHVLFQRRHWPQRRIAGTPDLFFLKDGRQVGEMLGWTADKMPQLRAQLAAIGLR